MVFNLLYQYDKCHINELNIYYKKYDKMHLIELTNNIMYWLQNAFVKKIDNLYYEYEKRNNNQYSHVSKHPKYKETNVAN